MAGVSDSSGQSGLSGAQFKEPRKALFRSPDQEDGSKTPGGLSGAQFKEPRKALFRSPDQEYRRKTPEALEALLNRIQVDIEVDSNLNSLRKDIHKQILTKLRQELTQLSQDEWMYKPIDQIIGF